MSVANAEAWDEPRELSKRVLILEDSFFLADDMRKSLEDAGYEVMGPFDGPSYELDKALVFPPDVAVVDIELNRQSAYGTIERLEKLDVRLVLATGYARSELPAQYTKYPLLKKPFAAQALVEAVKIALLSVDQHPTPMGDSPMNDGTRP